MTSRHRWFFALRLQTTEKGPTGVCLVLVCFLLRWVATLTKFLKLFGQEVFDAKRLAPAHNIKPFSCTRSSLSLFLPPTSCGEIVFLINRTSLLWAREGSHDCLFGFVLLCLPPHQLFLLFLLACDKFVLN